MSIVNGQLRLPFDPVVLGMLRGAADSCGPTLRGAVLQAYEHISKENEKAQQQWDEYRAAKCHGDPRSDCENHGLYNYCWECRTDRQFRDRLRSVP